MKAAIKIVAEAAAALMALPSLVLYYLSGLILGPDKAFPGWSQLFSLYPGLTGAYLRRAFYRQVFRRCGAGTWISFGTVFSHRGCTVGRNVYIGVYCCIGEVTLEDDVLIGSHVSIMNGSGQHGTDRLDIPVREQPGRWPHVTIGQDTWIGDRAIVMANVGRQCLIGAGAVVTEAIPDFGVAVGSPAKVIRYRTDTEVAGRVRA